MTQSDYENLTPQTSRIYFTSDTHRIYKGSDLYAATTFDQLNFSSIEASSITVDGSAVSLEGHSHSMSDIDGLSDAISAATSGFASEGHTHVIGDIQSLTAKVNGLTSNKVEKTNGSFTNLSADNADLTSISASTATFGDLIVTGDVTMSLSMVTFGSIMASDIRVDGTSVALVGHTHPASEITGLQSVLDGLSSTYALASHSHAISDVTGLPTIVSGITSSSIEKETGQFVNLNAINLSVSQLTVDATVVSANSMTVGGSNVSVEGHTHTMSEIEGLASGISGIESSISTIESSISTLESSVSAMATTLSGISETGISKQSATFQTLTVTGEVTMSLSSVDFQNINASSLTVNGSAVSLEGHSHSASEISGLDAAISAATSSFASSDHTHPELSGLTSSTITKDTGTFTNLVVASASFTATNVEAEEIIASTATFGDINVTGTASLSATHVSASTLTADSGTFTNLTVVSASFEATNVEATNIEASAIVTSSITVGGSAVALVGHTHPASEVTGLQSVLDGLSSTYASISHGHAISDITNLSTILTGITESDIEKDTVTADIGYFRLLSVSGSANFAVNTVSANAVTVNGTEVALSGHTHSVADIDGLSTTLGGFASSGHTHDELSGLTSSTIDRLSGSFNALTASTATFGMLNVTNSATFDITNLVASTISVVTLDVSST